MPIGALVGLMGRLGGGGLIRGTVGKVLRKGGGTAIVRRPPNLPTVPTFPRIPTGGSPGAVSGRLRRVGKGAAAAAGAAVVFDATGRAINAITGQPIRRSRRINPGNTKALKRSVRRITAAAKMYAKVLTAQKGTRSKGYTIKPKGANKCR
jgi:hypothetical protein